MNFPNFSNLSNLPILLHLKPNKKCDLPGSHFFVVGEFKEFSEFNEFSEFSVLEN